MLQKENLGLFVRQVPSAACAPFKAFAAWSVQLEARMRRRGVGQVRVSLPRLPALLSVHRSEHQAPRAVFLLASQSMNLYPLSELLAEFE